MDEAQRLRDGLKVILDLDDKQRIDGYGSIWLSPWARKMMERLVAGEIVLPQPVTQDQVQVISG